MMRIVAFVAFTGNLFLATPLWAGDGAVEKAKRLEFLRGSINYCIENIGRSTKDIDVSKTGRDILISQRITYGIIAWQYELYGDFEKAAENSRKDWINYRDNGLWEPLDEGDVLDRVIEGYEKAGMYKSLTSFYPQAYEEKIKHLSRISNVKLIKTDFAAYKKRWPQEAKEYLEFMRKWEEAKKLAKTTNPKPLDPAVQNHEWFYSDKQEEVLKALGYYHKHNVQFMLEKASKRDDKVISAKAKEYLANPVQEKEKLPDGDKSKK